MLAVCYAGQGDSEQAHRVLQEYVDLHPDNAWGHGFLSSSFIEQGNPEKALESVEQAISLNPGYVYLHFERWRVLVLQENWEEARVEATLSAGLPNRIAGLYVELQKAIVQLYHGRTQELLTGIDQALGTYGTQDPNSATFRNLASHVALEKGGAAQALEQAGLAERDGKGSVQECYGIFLGALAQANLGRWDEAEQTAERLRKIAEALPAEREKRRYHHLLGELALARGEIPSATQELERAASMLFAPTALYVPGGPLPPHVPIWFSLARAYMESGNEEKAAEGFKRIAESGAEHVLWPIPFVRSFYFLGKIHESRGEMEKAREYYRRFCTYWKDGDMDREKVEEAKQKLQELEAAS